MDQNVQKKNEILKEASGALFTHFYAIKIQKFLHGEFLDQYLPLVRVSRESGSGGRTKPYTKVLHFLIFCLLSVVESECE